MNGLRESSPQNSWSQITTKPAEQNKQGTSVEKEEFSARLQTLIQSSDALAAQALDSTKPLEERIQLINAPEIKELMSVFQQAKNPDGEFSQFAEQSWKQIDKLYQQFQEPLQEFSQLQTQKLLKKMHKAEEQIRITEQDLAQQNMQEIEESPLWFDSQFIVW